VSFIKKISITFLVALGVFVGARSALAQEPSVNIYFFYGDGCPHCAKEEPFLQVLEDKYPSVNVISFEVWNSPENQKIFKQVGKKLGARTSGVPFTLVGDKYVIGWLSEDTTGKTIEDAVLAALKNGCTDVVYDILNPSAPPTNSDPQSCPDNSSTSIPEEMELPFVGKIKTKNLSLPVFTVLLGVLDGFNPCAMWTLLFLISLLIGMENKKRMWILGSTFIIASAAVYFVFMSAWLNLLLFIGFIGFVRIGIGLVALGGGYYNLREYYTNPDATCKVTDSDRRRKIFEKLKKITQENNFLLALGGIVLLAFAVNLVELICSAGLPAVFTQVLTLSNLNSIQYYLYILLYIFFFMIDDLFVFFVAMSTLQMTGVTTKYTRFSHLIGGILMGIIGILLIFKPEVLMFG